MGTFELIAAIIGAVLGSSVLGSFIQNWFSRKKTSAEADAILSEKAIMYNDQLVKRIEKLEQDIKDMRKEYEEKIEVLRKENTSLHKDLSAVQKELEITRNNAVVKPS